MTPLSPSQECHPFSPLPLSHDLVVSTPVKWDTSTLENGLYEVLGLMHVSVKKGKEEKTIARQSIVEVRVKNAR